MAQIAQNLDLIRRAQRGEAQALEQLLLGEQAVCYAFALRLVSNRSDAEDVCQDAFLRAARDLAQFRPTGSFRSWLLSIVFRAHQNRKASELSRQARERSYPMEQNLQPEPSAEVERQELRQQVDAALKGLEENLRLPLSLHYEQGLSRAEVAEVLAIPEGTVATHIRRGIERLRESLAQSGLPLAESVLLATLQSCSVTVPQSLSAAIHALASTKSAVSSTAGAATLKLTLGLAAATVAVVAALALRPSAPASPPIVAPLSETREDAPKAAPLPFPVTSISGLVQDNKTRQPLSGVTVHLSTRPGKIHLLPGSKQIEGCPAAVTDSAGRYSIRVMLDSSQRWEAGVIPERSKYMGNYASVAFYQGEAVVAPVLSVVPYASLRGRVVAPDGKSIAGAIIKGYGGSSWTSDAAGRFKDDTIPSHRSSWDVTAPGYELRRFPVWIGDANPDELTVQLTPCKMITGKVIDSSGKPAVAVQVYGGSFPGTAFLPNWFTCTDDQGRFELSTAQQGELTWIFPVVNKHDLAAEPQKVAAGTQDLVLQLLESGTIEVAVKDKEGKPLEGLDVRVNAEPQRAHNSRLRWGRTDREGKALVLNVPVGSTKVDLREAPTDFAARLPLPSATLQVRAGQTHSCTLIVEPLPEDALYKVSGQLLDQDGRPVLHAHMGICFMKSRQPAGYPELYRSGSSRSRSMEDYSEWTRLDGRFQAQLQHDDGARSAMREWEPPAPKEPGKLRIVARLDGYSKYLLDQELEWPKDAKLLDLKKLTVQLAPERVFNIKTDRAGSTRLSPTVKKVSDEKGHEVPFRIIGREDVSGCIQLGLRAAGKVKVLLADLVGHTVPLEIPAEAQPGQLFRATFPATRTIEINVADAQGNHHPGITLQARPRKPEWPICTAGSDNTGTLRLEVAQAAEGEYILYTGVEHQPYRATFAPGDTPIKQSVQLKAADATISGRVTEAAGKPVPAARVHFHVNLAEGLNITEVIKADQEGRYSTPIPSGLQIQMRVEGQQQLELKTIEVKLASGQSLTQDLTVQPPADPPRARRPKPTPPPSPAKDTDF